MTLGWRGFHNPNVEVYELLGWHPRWRAHHEVLGALVLGERDHLADAVLVGEHADDAVDTGRDPTVRRCAVLERPQDVAEVRLDTLGRVPEQLEQARLNV